MRKWLVALALLGVALTQTASTRVRPVEAQGQGVATQVDVPGLITEAALAWGGCRPT